jgi:hypothetical protein
MEERGSGDRGEPTGTVVAFRRRGTTVLVAIPCAGFSLLLLAGALSSSGPWGLRVLAGLACLVPVIFVWRVGRLAIDAEPDALVIRNLRNTHRIPWSQVEDIYVTPPIPVAVYRENALATQDVSLLVRLKEGAVISATLYDSRMSSYSIQPRRRAMERLNELRRERSGVADRK